MEKLTGEVERIVNERLHAELQKLANIMGREFGDRTGRFVSLYATQLKEEASKV